MKESEYYGVLFSTSSTSKVPGKSWGRLVQVQKIESLVEEEKRKASLEKKKRKKKGAIIPLICCKLRGHRRIKSATYIGIFCIVTRDVV